MRKISTLFKIYTLPLAVVIVGLIIYWAIVTTIGKPEHVRSVMSKKTLSKEEEQLVMMQSSASEAFIKNTLAENLSKISQRGGTITSNEDGINTVATPVVISSISPKTSQILNKAVNNVKITPQESSIAREIEFNIPVLKRGTILVKAALLREAPSTKSKVLGRVFMDEKVVILDSKDGFYKVRFRGKVGYIAHALIEPEKPKKENPIELTLKPSNHADDKSKKEINKILDIDTKKEEASSTKTTLETKNIPKEANTKEVNTSDNVATKSEPAKVSKATFTNLATKSTKANMVGTVLVEVAVIRKEPNVKSEAIGKMEKGETFSVINSDYKHFFHIKYKDITGYVAKRLVYVEAEDELTPHKEDSETSTLPKEVLEDKKEVLEPLESKKAIVLAHSANVREEPNEESRIVAKSPRGREVNVLSVRDGWAFIEYEFKGKTSVLNIKGYILERLLKYEH
ncbi:hypothetical protein BKH43_05825 [Helicobacter sp. 13S00401-1]|uniref:SH3 domain-containing protein n=1 Tax=Helicobacter sp. 13S00401-1 TaxID=1905758 RepID=UPI000BA5BB3F|nr:SH3 domain-containing protein [Helicobacter sp. 13S00401-1]PAF50127.1 hypothetical protein BKH43_05825 [Helicobacter sp. 13S00401-1]